MTPLRRQFHRVAGVIDGLLGLADGRHRLERHPEEERFAAGDAAEHPASMVAGSAESFAFSGMNGENASNSTSTGNAASLYLTSASGYSPENSTSGNSREFNPRATDLPSRSTTTAKP